MGGIARALLSLRGRLARRQFWLAFFIVFVGGAFVSQDQQSGAGLIVGLVTLYVALCVYGKRLHDFGKSALYMVVPLGATFGYYAYAFAQMSQYGSRSPYEIIEDIRIAGLAVLFVWLIVTLWVGIHRGQKGDNRFGMDPSEKRSIPTAPPRDSD